MESVLMILFVSLAYLPFNGASYVPVLFLGSDNEHVPDDPTSAVHKLTDSEFREDFLRTLLDKGPVICFAQDELSLEDFSMFGNAYGNRPGKINPFANLAKRLDTMPSLLLPAVNMQASTLTSADNPKWNVIEVKDSQKSLKDSGIQLTANNLIVIPLPATKGATDRPKALQANDEIMEKFAKEFEDAGVKFTLIYTAQKPSWTGDQEDSAKITRNLLSVEDETSGCPMHDNENNTLLYITSVIAIEILNDTTYTQTFNCSEFELTSSHFASEYQSTLSRKNDEHKLTITFSFKEDRGYWLLVDIAMSAKLVNVSGDANLRAVGVWAPMGFSYTCQNSPFYQNKTNPNSKDPQFAVRLENFQIQPFSSNKTAKFGDPMDCVGFFTIPIWMSIFVTILLLIILAFGVQMVMSINTMDRFDDPKGKTIIVSNMD